VKILRLLVALAAVVALAVTGVHFLGATKGLDVSHITVGTAPVTIFRPDGGGPAPVVLIAHGFAGSQQLMLPFALTIARAGYIAVTFDFPGHGRNPAPLPGGIADDARASTALISALDQVAQTVRPLGDGRMAMLGHSMASDIVVRHLIAHPAAADAAIAVSVFARGATADRPRNMLVIQGALEPELFHTEAARLTALAGTANPAERTTYGRFADGTARRFVLSAGVEHIGVLYGIDGLAEARDWLNAAFGRTGNGEIEARGRWIGLLILAATALAWPLARLLPKASPTPRGAGLPWRRLWPIALLPAVATPLLLWKLPTDILPILLGDYLAVHFALYGALTALLLWRAGAPRPTVTARLFAAAAAVFAFILAAFFLPLDATALSFIPTGPRVLLIPAVALGTLPWFLADEWATRGPGAGRLAYAATKLCFLLSLAAAIALNLERLFFLIIIVPVILAFFLITGLLSSWANRSTGHPWVAGLANAVALAWAIAATFPAVAR
jgi:pimeloyl-ACP methyl ester carboxylesterase